MSDTFTADEDGNPEDLQFSFSFSDVTSSSLTVEIRPTPENALYFGALVSATFTEDDFKQYIEQVAQWYIQFGMATDVDRIPDSRLYSMLLLISAAGCRQGADQTPGIKGDALAVGVLRAVEQQFVPEHRV